LNQAKNSLKIPPIDNNQGQAVPVGIGRKKKLPNGQKI
jgi:hypothetical protein